MPAQSSSRATERRFTELYELAYRPLLGYVLRRVDQPADAADVLAEVFLVAWRRLDEVPGGDEGRLWLFGVARRTIANHRRGVRRREAATERLRAEFASMIAQVPDSRGPEEPLVASALERLSEDDREVLTLTVWEGLSSPDIARVLGLKPATVRVRLHRARGRLRAELQTAPELGIDRPAPHAIVEHATRSGAEAEA